MTESKTATPQTAAAAASADALFAAVYERLKAMAHRELVRGTVGTTLDTTALVHELYVKLAVGGDLHFDAPSQFFAYAARAMRHILIDRARRRLRLKAGAGEVRVNLTDPGAGAVSISPLQALQLDAALEALEVDDPRAARVVELHYFAGLSLEQVSEQLGVVRRTTDRDWRYARAFLLARIG